MRRLIAVVLLTLSALGVAPAAPGVAQAAAPCAATVHIVSLTFDPQSVQPGQSSVTTTVVRNCTGQSQSFSVMTTARFLGATSGIPAGCPVLDPLPPQQVTLAAGDTWTGTIGYSVFSGCSATALEVTARVADPTGAPLDTATADLPITAPAALCTASYRVIAQWNHGFVAEVTVTNTAGTAINGWTLSFVYGAGQRIASSWNATVTQASGTVDAEAENYNKTIASGASVTFGLVGTWSGTNPAPTTFTLNGAACRAA